MPLLAIERIDDPAAGYMGAPTVEAGGRLWAIRNGSPPVVVRSDDCGSTWTVWAEIPPGSAAPLNPWVGAQPCIRDPAGNIYYNCVTGQQPPGIRGLGRVDAVTKAVTKCFDLFASGMNPPSPLGSAGTDSTIFTWSWSFDSAGRLYIAQYANNVWNGATWEDRGFQGLDSHYLWRSEPGGLSWTRIDSAVVVEPDCRHFHAVHCNPYDDVLWLTIGDDKTATFFSTDGGETLQRVTNDVWAPHQFQHHVGLTFTTEATYFSDDLAEQFTNVWRTPSATVRTPLVSAFGPPPPWRCPWYYIRACGPDEIWGSAVNDGAYEEARSSLVRLTKTPGTLGPWTATSVIEAPDHTYASTVPYDLSHNGRGVMPDGHPYMYVQTVAWGTPPPHIGLPLGVYRVQRVSDAALAAWHAARQTQRLTVAAPFSLAGTAITASELVPGVRTAAQASAVSEAGGAIIFDGPHADRFSATPPSLPPGGGAFELAVTPQISDAQGTLTARLGVPE